MMSAYRTSNINHRRYAPPWVEQMFSKVRAIDAPMTLVEELVLAIPVGVLPVAFPVFDGGTGLTTGFEGEGVEGDGTG